MMSQDTMPSVDTTNNGASKRPSPKTIGIVVFILVAVGIASVLLLRGIPATDIVFYEDSIELISGDTQVLLCEVLPNNATSRSLRWTSSNPSVAIVDENGTVTALSKGETVITVATSNGKVDECLVSVKPTAFDYLKELGSAPGGYTVGSYVVDSGARISIGLSYNSAENALYLMNMYEGGYKGSHSLGGLVVPSSLSGDYEGTLERYFSGTTVNTAYHVVATEFTANTKLKSYYCDSGSWLASDSDQVYTSEVHTLLTKVYDELLEPNGYTYADLGFHSYG